MKRKENSASAVAATRKRQTTNKKDREKYTGRPARRPRSLPAKKYGGEKRKMVGTFPMR